MYYVLNNNAHYWLRLNMKILVCQISPKVGDLEGNYASILRHYKNSINLNADICFFPELAICGYLAEDLFTQDSFLEDIQRNVDKLVAITEHTCLVLPIPILESDCLLYNGVIAAKHGKIIGKTYKRELPNYGIFDEKRYFNKGTPTIITINGQKIGVPICEDIWFDKVCTDLTAKGAKLFLVPNASPYEKEKMQKRLDLVKQRFNETQVPIIYCNQVLGHDGIIFDGRSFCYDGELKIIGKAFKPDQQLVEMVGNKFQCSQTYDSNLSVYDEIFHAMVLGLRDYVQDNCFEKVLLGLSGGIDSALVALIAKEALGSENVTAYMLPSQFTSDESIEDARELANNLGIDLKSINIEEVFQSFLTTLSKDKLIEENSITFQNLQSRIRGTILMAKANENNSLLITTGNKSEYATGYATIYGDMNGGFNPIKDIYKTELYALVRHINKKMNIIPKRIITKAPSAELAPGQKDSDSLPEYPILDKILEDYIENCSSLPELSKKYTPELALRIVKLVKNTEFKRKQSAPGVKISKRNFEKDRRFPITNFYNSKTSGYDNWLRVSVDEE